jgi:hypothetical protein
MPDVPAGAKRVQNNDVYFAKRGLIYLIDRTRGLHILERTPALRSIWRKCETSLVIRNARVRGQPVPAQKSIRFRNMFAGEDHD